MITNLTNTTWVIKENFVAYPSDYVGTYIVNFSLWNAAGVLQSSERKFLQIGIFTTGTIANSTTRYENSVNAYGSTQGQLSPSLRHTVESGSKILFTSGTDIKNSRLISWLTENAWLVEPIKVECSIDFEDEWKQEDCHWELDGVFTFTCKIFTGDLINKITGEAIPGESRPISPGAWINFNNGYLQLTRALAAYWEKTTIASANYNDSYDRCLEIYKYFYRLSDYSDLTKLRNSEGYIPVKLSVIDSSKYSVSAKFPLDLPPDPITKVNIDYYNNSPTDFICSWSEATYCDDCQTNSVAGYSIEIEYQPEGSTEYIKMKGLYWDADKLNENKYWLRRNTDYKELVSFTPVSSIDDIAKVEITFVGSNWVINKNNDLELMPDSEVYLLGPDSTSFCFTPSELGISKGQSFKIYVYPYHVYSTDYDDEGKPIPGTLLSYDSVTFGSNTVSKGVVRVKTNSGWVEGQVWVRTASGWSQAEAIYTKTSDGWKEAN